MMPLTAVYFVLPSRIAFAAASLMWSGVSKSGSPAPKPITSRPTTLSSTALVVTAIVGEGLIRASREARKDTKLQSFQQTIELGCSQNHTLQQHSTVFKRCRTANSAKIVTATI